MATSAAQAAQAADARLVRCGEATCLRLSGHRATSSDTVRIGNRNLTVEGGRAWRTTLSLATARDWTASSTETLTLSLTGSGGERTETVALPPGAFGRRVELAALVIRAH